MRKNRRLNQSVFLKDLCAPRHPAWKERDMNRTKKLRELKPARAFGKFKFSLSALFMLLPFFLLFFVFTVLPVLMSLPLSFTEYDMANSPRFAGLDNYYNLFLKDDVFLISLQNTVIFAVVTGPVAYAACFMLAWLIHRIPKALGNIFTFAFYAPALAGNIYATWKLIYNGNGYGIANAYLMESGLISAPKDWLTDPQYVFAAVVIVQLWLSLGAGFLALRSGLAGIPKEYYEAGRIEGIEGTGQELLYITIPSMGPQLLFAAVVQVAASFTASDIGRRLTDFPSTDYRAHTLMSHIYDYGNIRFEMGYAAAVSVVMFGIMIFTNWGIRKILAKYTEL